MKLYTTIPIKYNGQYVKANSEFTADAKDVESLLAIGITILDNQKEHEPEHVEENEEEYVEEHQELEVKSKTKAKGKKKDGIDIHDEQEKEKIY